MNQKVTIITVCFNSSRTIKDTINSVLNQNYLNIEYIILDGNSTDDTIDIIRSYGDQIDIFKSGKDKGMYDALNRGIKLATGDIIGILNSDDFYSDSQVIDDVIKKMDTEHSDALYADLYYVDNEDIQKVKRYWKSGKYEEGQFLNGWMPPHPTFFVRKRVYEKFGVFNLDFISAADYELMLRFIHKHKIKLAYLPRVIVHMREGGLSNASIKNRLRANNEDKKAWETNNLTPKKYTLVLKPLRKIIQFIRR